jgi:hypothetical protein
MQKKKFKEIRHSLATVIALALYTISSSRSMLCFSSE